MNSVYCPYSFYNVNCYPLYANFSNQTTQKVYTRHKMIRMSCINSFCWFNSTVNKPCKLSINERFKKILSHVYLFFKINIILSLMHTFNNNGFIRIICTQGTIFFNIWFIGCLRRSFLSKSEIQNLFLSILFV